MLFHNATHYTNFLSYHIHVNTTYLLHAMCTLVAWGMTLGRLECMWSSEDQRAKSYTCDTRDWTKSLNASFGVCVCVCSCVCWQCCSGQVRPLLIQQSLKPKSQKLLSFCGQIELDEPNKLSPISFDVDQFWGNHHNPRTPGLQW
jgi:hypothetical protein